MLPIIFYLWTDVQLFFLIVKLFSDIKINISFHHAECSLKTDAVIMFSDHFEFYFDMTQSSGI